MTTRLLLIAVSGAAALMHVTASASAQQTVKSGAATLSERIDSSRLVIAGGALTEIVYTLGRSDGIVAVDTTSLFPEGAFKTKRSIGYFRALSTEGVLSMAPTAILASDKAGPPEVVRALKASAVPYIEIDDRADPLALLARVRRIARAIDKEAEGETLARRIETEFTALETARRSIPKKKRVLFVFSAQGGRIVAGGRNTAADAMLELAGGQNVVQSFEGYKTITEEAVVALDPEAIVVVTRSGEPSVREALLALPSLRATIAGQRVHVVELDALYLLGFGPRAADAARELMTGLYPDMRVELGKSQ